VPRASAPWDEGAIGDERRDGRGVHRVAVRTTPEPGLPLRPGRRNESGYFAEAYTDRLPRADIGKSCVRFKKLDDVDVGVLEDLIRKAIEG
jgi:hypothetical protein